MNWKEKKISEKQSNLSLWTSQEERLLGTSSIDSPVFYLRILVKTGERIAADMVCIKWGITRDR